MTEINTYECRFCQKVIHDNKFDTIGEVTRQMLNALLLKVTFDQDKKSVMCLECATKLQNALDFKTICLSIDSKMSPSDFEDNIQPKKKKGKKNMGIVLTNVPKARTICEFCMRLTEIGSCTYLKERTNVFMIDMVQKHIPELHFNFNGKLATCDTCLSSLQSLSSFITLCYQTEELQKGNRKGVDGQFKLNDSKDFPLKYEDEKNYNIRVEDITVKNEVEHEDGTDIENLDVDMKSEEMEKLKHDNEMGKYNCEEECLHQTVKIDRKRQTLTQHRKITKKVHHCECCSFKTKRKYDLKTHMLVHQSPSEVQMYNCESCSYVTNRKGSLKRHSAIHLRAEIETSSCEYCSLKSKIKQSLKSHKLTYIDSSESTSSSCDQCTCNTKNKQS